MSLNISPCASFFNPFQKTNSPSNISSINESKSDDLSLKRIVQEAKEIFCNPRCIALGIISHLAAIPIIGFSANSIESALTAAGKIRPNDAQEIILVLQAVDNIASSFLKLTLKVALIAFITFVGPILEEILCRDMLYEKMQNIDQWIWGPSTNKLVQKVTRVVANGVLFGAAHLSPFQGWLNIPIFVACSLMGIVFAGLREYTGNITASSSAHIFNNSLCMIQLSLKA